MNDNCRRKASAVLLFLVSLAIVSAVIGGSLSSSAAESLLTPSAPLTTSYGNDRVVVDISNRNDGYVMVRYTGDKSDARVQVNSPDGKVYAYSIPKGKYQVLPLTGGNGDYSVAVYEHLDNSRYTMALNINVKTVLRDELLPFLYPNQYVNYTDAPKTVALSNQLAAGASSRLEIVQMVYNHVIGSISYDYQKADSVKFSYIPNLDAVLASGKGICFDYAAVMTGMLRVQGIPARMEFGYVSGGVYHAWLSIYLPEEGWVNGIIHFDGKRWQIMDPTFAAGGNSAYVGSGADYSAIYFY